METNFGGPNDLIGGCAGTQYGCCPDGFTAKSDKEGSNCRPTTDDFGGLIGGCAGTRCGCNGCCPDGFTAKSDKEGSNCPTTDDFGGLIGGCAGTQYGCCGPDNQHYRNADGTCNDPNPPPGGCAGTRCGCYGCCPDGTTAKFDKDGSNCPPAPPPVPPTPPTPPTPPVKREFDQILSGDVTIKKICNSDNEYKITLVSNVSKVLLYQVWSPTSAALNSDRKVYEVNAKKWVEAAFRKVEIGNVPIRCLDSAPAYFAPVICSDGKKYDYSSLAECAGQKDCKPYIPFTPTCVMELDAGECPVHHKGERCNHGECRHVFVINNAKVKDGHVVFYVSSEDIDPNNKNKVIKKIKKIPTTKKDKMFHHARFDIDPQYCYCGSGPDNCDCVIA